MGENRADVYIAAGLNRGVDRFLDNIEKRKEEEKNKAKKFKSLVSYAEASGLLSKDQAEVMDVDSLDGFISGKMAQRAMRQEEAKANLAQYAAAQRISADQGMMGFSDAMANNLAMGYSSNLNDFYENPEGYGYQRPQGNYMDSFNNAMTRFPAASTDERFGSVRGAFEQFAPPQPAAPSVLEKELGVLEKIGVSEEDRKKIAIYRASMAHPSGQDRFDLPYSDQLLMKNELDALTANLSDPIARLDFNKQATAQKLSPQQFYEQKLEAIDKKYKARARKVSEDAAKEATKEPLADEKVRVKSPTGQVGFIKKSQLEQAKKEGYTLVE